MNALFRIWDRFEEAFIVFLLVAMTLVTFVYVMLNNLYSVFYAMAEWFTEDSKLQEWMYAVGDFLMDGAQAMTWSNALTKALFAWLIFFGIAYGVRVGGHIGVDALVKLASRPVQRIIGFVAVAICLGYAGLMTVASYNWVNTLMVHHIGADDLGQFGIAQWHINMIVPISFALVLIRFLEIFVRILRNEQTGLGLADEAADAMKLSDAQE
ncbi:MAG: TRAP transporter small permease [Thiopseudomonas sp.]|nr:TRAP transporter small permease [Thiopseudomonas sp.]